MTPAPQGNCISARIDVAERIEPAHRQHDLGPPVGRRGAADEPGVAALGHDRDVVLAHTRAAPPTPHPCRPGARPPATPRASGRSSRSHSRPAGPRRRARDARRRSPAALRSDRSLRTAKRRAPSAGTDAARSIESWRSRHCIRYEIAMIQTRSAPPPTGSFWLSTTRDRSSRIGTANTGSAGNGRISPVAVYPSRSYQRAQQFLLGEHLELDHARAEQLRGGQLGPPDHLPPGSGSLARRVDGEHPEVRQPVTAVGDPAARNRPAAVAGARALVHALTPAAALTPASPPRRRARRALAHPRPRLDDQHRRPDGLDRRQHRTLVGPGAAHQVLLTRPALVAGGSAIRRADQIDERRCVRGGRQSGPQAGARCRAHLGREFRTTSGDHRRRVACRSSSSSRPLDSERGRYDRRCDSVDQTGPASTAAAAAR